MEELLIKYMFDECSPEEKELIESELKSNPALFLELKRIKKLDRVMSLSNLLTPAPKELKLKILDKLIPAINLEQNNSKSYFEYILPVLFGIGSVIYFLFYANTEASSKWAQYINPDYIKYFSFAGMSMVGLLILDQLLIKKESKLHLMA